MADIQFKGELPKSKRENKIKQGDFVYCQATAGAHSFWGIYGHDCGVVSLDGASTSYIREKEVYLGETYLYWTIIKRVSSDNMRVFLEEIDKNN